MRCPLEHRSRQHTFKGSTKADFHVVIPSGCFCKDDFVQFWVYLNVFTRQQAAPGFQLQNLDEQGGSPPKQRYNYEMDDTE